MSYKSYRPFFSTSNSTYLLDPVTDEATLFEVSKSSRMLQVDFDLYYGITYFKENTSGLDLKAKIYQDPPNCFLGYSLDKKVYFEMHLHPVTNNIVYLVFKDKEQNAIVKYYTGSRIIKNGFYVLK